MRISTKGRYALRLMLELALSDGGEYIPLKAVAESQEISEKYLEQIVNVLNKAGYVKSVRGAQGGYKLTLAPQKYTVGMILRLMEGDLAPVFCVENGEEAGCGRHAQCVTVELWRKVKAAVEDVVDNITLADLVNRHREKNACGEAAEL